VQLYSAAIYQIISNQTKLTLFHSNNDYKKTQFKFGASEVSRKLLKGQSLRNSQSDCSTPVSFSAEH